MTPKKAKELSLEVWRHLAEHPETKDIITLPKNLLRKWKDSRNTSPLCKVIGYGCVGCPMGYKCKLYSDWTFADDDNTRQLSAQKIAAAIEAWEPGEEQSET